MGAQNCFLNTLLQLLWHTNAFRERLLHDRAHACVGDGCVICALRAVLRGYADGWVVSPDALRVALARARPAEFPMGARRRRREPVSHLRAPPPPPASHFLRRTHGGRVRGVLRGRGRRARVRLLRRGGASGARAPPPRRRGRAVRAAVRGARGVRVRVPGPVALQLRCDVGPGGVRPRDLRARRVRRRPPRRGLEVRAPRVAHGTCAHRLARGRRYARRRGGEPRREGQTKFEYVVAAAVASSFSDTPTGVGVGDAAAATGVAGSGGAGWAGGTAAAVGATAGRGGGAATDAARPTTSHGPRPRRKWDCGTRQCEQRQELLRHLLSVPSSFVVNVVFGSAKPSRSDVQAVMDCLSEDEFVHLGHIFASCAGDEGVAKYGLRGFICYSSVHYVSFFYYNGRQKWVKFDDRVRVRSVQFGEGLARVRLTAFAVRASDMYADGVLEGRRRQLRDGSPAARHRRLWLASRDAQEAGVE